MMYYIKEVLTGTWIVLLTCIICGFIVIGLIAFIYSTYQLADYTLDKSICNVYVENKKVYEGRCHFVSVSSIGENGNTKHLSIGKDILNLKAAMHIINNDIRVEEGR